MSSFIANTVFPILRRAFSAKVIATGRPPDVEEARQAMKGGEAEVHTSSVTGLNSETKAAAQVQWEPVDFEDLNAVHKVATRLASELERLDVVSLHFAFLRDSDMLQCASAAHLECWAWCKPVQANQGRL